MTSPLASFAINTPADLAAFLSLVALALSIGWVLFRAGSMHALRRRAWQLLFGDAALTDGQVKAFVEAQTSLNAFRFESGLKANNLQTVHRLLAWLKANREDASTIAACGSFFDLQTCEPKLPQNRRLWLSLLSIGALASMVVAVASLHVATNSKAYLQVKVSGTDFMVAPDATAAQRLNWWPLGSDPSPLTRKACDGELAAVLRASEFSRPDADVVCGLLKDSEAARFLERTLRRQGIAFGFFSAVFGVFMYCAVRCFFRLVAALELQKRLMARGTENRMALALIQPGPSD